MAGQKVPRFPSPAQAVQAAEPISQAPADSDDCDTDDTDWLDFLTYGQEVRS